MAFPKGFRLIGGLYYKNTDRSGPYIIAPDGTATLMNGIAGGGSSSTAFIPTLQREMPADGDTVTLIQSDAVVTLLIEGTDSLDSLTIVLPQPGSSSPGQIVRIVSWVDIANVSYGDADVNGAATQLFSGDGISIQNIQDNQWLVLP